MDFGDLRLPPRFWRRVEVEHSSSSSPLSSCWLWTGYLDDDGYARFHVHAPRSVSVTGKRSVLAHRYAYLTAISRDYFLDHTYRGVDIHHACPVSSPFRPPRHCVRPHHMRETEKAWHGWWHGKNRNYSNELCTGTRFCLCWECCERNAAEVETRSVVVPIPF